MKTNFSVVVLLASMLTLVLQISVSASVDRASGDQQSLLTYCSSHGASTYWEYIDYLAIGNIARTSGAETGGYYDGSALSTDVTSGSTYNLTYSHANPHGGYVEDWSIYIDWNADGDFADAGELVFNATTYTAGNYTTPITIPATATNGTTRMRVSMGFQYYGFPPACGTFAQGEVEDYSLNIIGASSCTESYEPNNTKVKAKTITLNTDILSQVSTATDVDWFSFSNTTNEPNIKVTLTMLPANYNLKLFDPTGVNVKTSAHSGTSDESIIFNTATVGTWKVKVYGASGAYSNTQCYTLKAVISSTPFKLSDGSGITNILRVYPVPASDAITVSFVSDYDAASVISVFNSTGQIVYEQQQEILQGENKININVFNLTAGIYYIAINDGDRLLKKEFVVTK